MPAIFAGWSPGATRAATGDLRLSAEASGHLVGFLIFKISVTEYPGQAGSIPVRLRRFGGPPPPLARKVFAHGHGSASRRPANGLVARRLAPRRAATSPRAA